MEEEENVDLSLNEVLTNRVLTTVHDLSIDSVENEVIRFSLENSEKFISTFPNMEEVMKTLFVIDRNFYYDSYRFAYGDRVYVLKFGSKEDSYVLDLEAKFLKKLKNKNLAPTFYISDVSSHSSISVTSYEFGAPIKQTGLSTILQSIDEFTKQLKSLHNVSRPKRNQTKDLLDRYKIISNFSDILPDSDYKKLKEIKYFRDVESFIPFVLNVLKLQLDPLMEAEGGYLSICHLNLDESTILERNGMFKFINFENALHLNPMLDLALLSLRLGFNSHPKFEDTLITSYLKKQDEGDFKSAFPAFKDVAFKIILLELISSQFYRILYPKWEASQSFAVKTIKTYQNIRPLVSNEFPNFLDTTDLIFGNLNNSI